MKVRAYKYSLPFKTPVLLKTGPITQKSGFIIRVDHEGKTGWGDASPLEGYSPETFSEVEAALATELTALSETGASYNGDAKLPSLACGIQFACREVRSESPVYQPVESARLLNGTSGDSLRAAAVKAISGGHTCLKIKVGRNNVSTDVRHVRELQEMLPDGISLRLDANRRWSLDQALQFSEAVGSDHISFIEEPLGSDADYEEFDRLTNIPFAFDESLQWRANGDVGLYRNLAAIVLKPSLLGGPKKISEWRQLAEAHDLDCVISAMYESGVGMRALIALASAPPYCRVPAGLDTYGALAYDAAVPSLEIVEGLFKCGNEWKLDLDIVELVYDGN